MKARGRRTLCIDPPAVSSPSSKRKDEGRNETSDPVPRSSEKREWEIIDSDLVLLLENRRVLLEENWRTHEPSFTAMVPRGFG